MAIDTYIRGVDSIEVELVLLDEDDAVIDPTSLDDIKVEIITKTKAIPVNNVYWEGTLLGGEVVTTDASAGKVSIYLDPTDHDDWPISKDYYARTTLTETDVNYSSGNKYSAAVERAFRLTVE